MKRPLASTADDGLPHEQQNPTLDSPRVSHSGLDDDADDGPAAKCQRLTDQAVADATQSHVSSDAHKNTSEAAVSSSDSNDVLPFPQEENTTKNRNTPSFLGTPKDIRLHIYEYLVPRAGPIPSARKETDVDRALEYEQRPASIIEGSAPAILRVNRQIYDEALGFMQQKLTFQVDILSRGLWEDKKWRFECQYSKLRICSSKRCVARNLINLTNRVKHMRHIALRVWVPRKLGQASNNSGEPSISGYAKSIKEHVNRLVVALMQAPYLESVDVQFQLHRLPSERSLPPTHLDPVVLDDSEILDLVAWYTQPFKLLRGINVDFRFLGEVYTSSFIISDTLATNLQDIFDVAKKEISGDTPINIRIPLCALYEAFLDIDVFQSLNYNREREPECKLPVILETLWEAQDTGDRETFSEMVREVHKVYEVVSGMARREYEGFLKME